MANYPQTTTTSFTSDIVLTYGGKVGIGTTTPVHDLHIKDDSVTRIRVESEDANSHAGVELKNDAMAWLFQIQGGDGDKLYVWDDNASVSRFTIDTDGNVGIGETSPDSKLEVRNDNSGTTFGDNLPLTITNANTTQNNRCGIAFSDGSGTATEKCAGIDIQFIRTSGTPAKNDTALTIWTRQADNDAFEAVVVSSSQTVGIGVTSPDTRLHVDGAVTLEPTITPATGTLTQDAEARCYVRNNKFVIQFNDGGTIRYKYLDLSGTGVTWQHSTTAP